MSNSTAQIERLPNGMTCVSPNRVTAHSEEFYVSYNNYDRSTYGSDTTALVVGQRQRFYVLNGNHEKQLTNKSFDECLNYVHDHSNLLNKFSDKLPERGLSVKEILAIPDFVELLLRKGK